MNRYVTNPMLKAWVVFQTDASAAFGFLDDDDEEFFVPVDLVCTGYHYEKGGEKYRQVCEWIESIKEGKKA